MIKWDIKNNICVNEQEYPLCDCGQYCLNSNKLITVSSRILYLWDIEINGCILQCEKSIQRLRGITESPDGKNIIICEGNDHVTIYDSSNLDIIGVF